MKIITLGLLVFIALALIIWPRKWAGIYKNKSRSSTAC